MNNALYIGLMSGTSLDGVDAVLVEFNDLAEPGKQHCRVIHTHSLPYSTDLRAELISLHTSTENELERTALVGNALANLYAETIDQLLTLANIERSLVTAIGCHGQTIRHRPELGFTLQIGNPALLTELTGITVVADFRSRDIAAGGQGAPLVPAFHQAVFADSSLNRIVINIGGIANLSNLPTNGMVSGFDSGPGNMLMDAWAERHLGKRYDESGSWAATGQVIASLLTQLLAEPYLQQLPPKSTGRDLFSLSWLEQHLQPNYAAADVQCTLLEFSARSIADAAKKYCDPAVDIYLCGGGARNTKLVERLRQLLPNRSIHLSDELGISIDWVEATAFAWLAKQTITNRPGNLPDVTGAKGFRTLGAIYQN